MNTIKRIWNDERTVWFLFGVDVGIVIMIIRVAMDQVKES